MIRVNATGCSLVDNLYGHVDFSTDTYRRLSSRRPGDGGLATGGLVFAEAFTNFALAAAGSSVRSDSRGEEFGDSGGPDALRGRKEAFEEDSEGIATGEYYQRILKALTGTDTPDSSNIGGPGIVPIIHADQVKRNKNIRYRFAGVLGRDENGRRFRELLEKTGFSLKDYTESDLPTPSTDVLSDPAFDKGRGERTFINTIGAAAEYGPDSLPADFFDAEILLFGGTALVPPLHDKLDDLCRRGREKGAFVMVTTVFDFRNEARLQGRPWPLVDNYENIDLLAADREEALKISGEASVEAAVEWFLKRGCPGVIVTRGAEDVLIGTRDTDGKHKQLSMPTCRYADEVAASLKEKHDTTGCGDNFVGGIIDSLAHQMAENPEGKPDLEESVISGIAAGSLALTCLGGVYYEKNEGQKLKALQPYFEAYRRELNEQQS